MHSVEMLHTDRSLNDLAINNGFPNSRAFAKILFKALRLSSRGIQEKNTAYCF